MLNRIKSSIQLTVRERYAVYAAALVIGLFMVIRFLVIPILDERSRAEKIIFAKKKILSEMTALQTEQHILLEKRKAAETLLAQRVKNFTLFSFLDELAGQSGIKDRVAFMKPSASAKQDGPYRLTSIEMKFESISTEEFISFLYKIETSNNLIRVNRLSVSKTGSQDTLLDALFQIETIEL